MTKREHKKLITIETVGKFKKAYYLNIYCGTYTSSWKTAEIKENVYTELKERNMLTE